MSTRSPGRPCGGSLGSHEGGRRMPVRSWFRRTLVILVSALLGGVLVAATPAGAAGGSSQGWGPSQPPDPGAAENYLTGVTVLSGRSAWAVGWWSDGPDPVTQRYTTQTLIEHWNGSTWKVQPSPNPGTSEQSSNLIGVAATSPTNAWAVGRHTDNTNF